MQGGDSGDPEDSEDWVVIRNQELLEPQDSEASGASGSFRIQGDSGAPEIL